MSVPDRPSRATFSPKIHAVPTVTEPRRPAPGQPGTLGQQLITLALSLHYGEQRGTTAAACWADARREVMGQ
jgi:hypothetical protein